MSAEYLVLQEENLHRVPKEIDTAAATFVGTLGCGARHSAASDDSSHDRVFLLGDGKLGQLIAQTLALTGCELLLVGRRPQKLALLSGRGITTGTAEDVYAGASYVAV